MGDSTVLLALTPDQAHALLNAVECLKPKSRAAKWASSAYDVVHFAVDGAVVEEGDVDG